LFFFPLDSAVSLGVGVASIAVTGWRLSSRKSSQFEAELAGMAQNLKEKEAQLEELKLSELRLEASGLSAFLNEEVSPEEVLKTSEASLDDKEVAGFQQFFSSSPITVECGLYSEPVIQKAPSSKGKRFELFR
jgi:hypothetical protein